MGTCTCVEHYCTTLWLEAVHFCRLAPFILVFVFESWHHTLLVASVLHRFMLPFKLQDMLGPEQVQNYDGLYGQGPPSVHSSHGGRQYQQPGKCFTSALPLSALVARVQAG